MARSTYPIYRSGEVVAHAESIDYIGDRMGDEYVSVCIKSAYPVHLQCGDYLEYRGEKWSVSLKTQVKKSARPGTHRESFVYDGIKLWPASYELRRLEMQDVVIGDNNLVTLMPQFSFYAPNVVALAERIKANLDREYSGDLRWKVRVLITKEEGEERENLYYVCGYNKNIDTLASNETGDIPVGFKPVGDVDKEISISSEKLWAVLTSKVSGDFKVNWIVKGRTITIGTEGISYGDYFGNRALMYGMNKGCVSIEAVPDENPDNICTRLRAYGNSKNMPARYYQRKHLTYYGVGKFGFYSNIGSKDASIDITGIRPSMLRGFTEVSLPSSDVKQYSGTINVSFDNKTFSSLSAIYYDNVLKIRTGEKITNIEDVTNSKDYTVYFDKKCIKTEYWPVKWLTVDNTSVIPDNVNVDKLMLPGFPDYPVRDYVTSVKTTKGITITSQGDTKHQAAGTYFIEATLATTPATNEAESAFVDGNEHQIECTFSLEGYQPVMLSVKPLLIPSKAPSKMYIEIPSASSLNKEFIENAIEARKDQWFLADLWSFVFTEGSRETKYIFIDAASTQIEESGYSTYVTLNIPFSDEYFSGEMYGTIDGVTYKLTYDKNSNRFKILSDTDIPNIVGKTIYLTSGVDFDVLPSQYINIIETTHHVDNGSNISNDPYLESENIKTLGLFEQNVVFDGSVDGYDDIYPTIKEVTVGQVRNAGYFVPSVFKDDERIDVLGGEKIATQILDNGIFSLSDTEQKITNDPFDVWIKKAGFDLLEASKNTTESMSIAFKTGKLAGREFSIEGNPIDDGDYWKLRLHRIADDAIGRYFPCNGYNLEAGDEFVLLGFPLPDMYVEAASQRLLESAQRYLKEHDYVITTYQIEVDEIYMQRQHDWSQNASNGQLSLHDNLAAGDMIVIDDDDILNDITVVDDNDGSIHHEKKIFIDKIEIKEGESQLPTYSITLRENKKLTKWEQIEVNVSNTVTSVIESSNSQGAALKRAMQQYTPSVVDGDYLPLEGGEITGDLDVDGDLSVGGNTKLEGNVGISRHSSVKSDDFSSTTGMGIYRDSSGLWHVATDIVDARVKLTAKEVEVQKVSSIGGALMLSAANGVVDHVGTMREILLDGGESISPVLYFKTTDDSGRVVSCNWKKYDILYCETFNLIKDDDGVSGSRIYKYVVKNVITNPMLVGGEEGFVGVVLYVGGNSGYLLAPWIENTVTPKAGDSVVQIGNTRELDRQRAIALAGAGSGSPYIYMWKGIDGYALGKPIIKLDEEPEMTLKSFNVVVNGGSRDIADMLSDSMNIYTLGDEENEVLAPVDGDGNVTDQTVGVAGWPDVEESWTDFDGHVGDYAVTTDSYYYRFEFDGTRYYWNLVTDEHLITALDAAAEAKRSADKALGSLRDMASDNVITAQEKQSLVREFNDIKNEFRAIRSEALKYKEVEKVSNANRDLLSSYQGVTFFFSLLGLTNKPYSTTDTDITDASYVVGSSYYEGNNIDLSKEYHFAEMMELYYNCYCNLRKELSAAIYQKISDAALSGGNLDDNTKDAINYLTTNFEQSCNDWLEGTTFYHTMLTMNEDFAALSAWKKNHDGSVEGSGFVTEAQFSMLFSQHVGENGDIALARAFTSVAWEKKADGSYGWQSGFTIDADVVKINSQNFKVNVDGDGSVYVRGEIHAESGTFNGTVSVGSSGANKQRIEIKPDDVYGSTLDFYTEDVWHGGFHISGSEGSYFTLLSLRGFEHDIEYNSSVSPKEIELSYLDNYPHWHITTISADGITLDSKNKISFYTDNGKTVLFDSDGLTSDLGLKLSWEYLTNATSEIRTSKELTNNAKRAIITATSEITITLPSGVTNGHEVWLCNTTGKRVNVAPNTSQSITGGGTWFQEENRWNVYIYFNGSWIYGLMNK